MSPDTDQRGDWAAQTAEQIENVIGLVRDKATIPIQTVARFVVYGVALTVLAILTITLITIAGIRALDNYLPIAHHQRVWVSYLIVGGIFTLSGLFLLGKAEASPRDGT